MYNPQLGVCRRNQHQALGVIVNPSSPSPLPAAALKAPDAGNEAAMLNPSSDAFVLPVEEFDTPRPRSPPAIDSPSAACALLGAALVTADIGVVDRVGT